MRILIVGGTGTLGSAVSNELAQRHEIITVGHRSGDLQVDITDVASIQAMYEAAGPLDAVIATTGHAHFGPLATLDDAAFQVGLRSKLMGQINLVLEGLDRINEGGSFTLTSGILNRDPVRGGTTLSTVNGALEGFVTGAAIEMPRRLRLNLVSPGLVEASVETYAGAFPGHVPVSMYRLSMAYVKCVEGLVHGKVVTVD